MKYELTRGQINEILNLRKFKHDEVYEEEVLQSILLNNPTTTENGIEVMEVFGEKYAVNYDFAKNQQCEFCDFLKTPGNCTQVIFCGVQKCTFKRI